MMNCEPCGKSFTGTVCYDQHLKSEKHKRKVMNLAVINKINNGEFSNSVISDSDQILEQKYQCPACKIRYKLFEDYQSHTLSSLHISNVQSLQNGVKNSDSCFVSSSTSDESTDTVITENTFLSSNNEIDLIIPPTQSYQRLYTDCKICDKQFSGPEPYKQHMESIGHKKKLEMKNFSSTEVNGSSNSLVCDVCNKIFSGYIPYSQHMSSDTHKKKIQIKKLQEIRINTQTESISECDSSVGTCNTSKIDNAVVNRLWYCRLCDIQCTGFISYNQHCDGITHLKNLKKAENKSNMLLSEIAVEQQCNLRSEEKIISQQLISHMPINQNNKYQPDELNQKMESDYILPLGIENLKLMSANELMLTVFPPETKISFDKTEKLNESKEFSNENEINNETYVCGAVQCIVNE